MKVRHFMTSELVTLHADSPLVDAEEVMGWRRFRHLPVVEGKGKDQKLVGLVTHRDLLRSYSNSVQAEDHVQRLILKASVNVREIMHTRIATIGPDESLIEAAKRLRTGQYGCLPVVEAGGKLVGIITEADFVHLTEKLLERLQKDNPELLGELTASLDRRKA